MTLNLKVRLRDDQWWKYSYSSCSQKVLGALNGICNAWYLYFSTLEKHVKKQHSDSVRGKFDHAPAGGLSYPVNDQRLHTQSLALASSVTEQHSLSSLRHNLSLETGSLLPRPGVYGLHGNRPPAYAIGRNTNNNNQAADADNDANQVFNGLEKMEEDKKHPAFGSLSV